MSAYKYLIVGLGNPGEKYSGNRHNIGWMAVEEFLKRHDGKIVQESDIYLACEVKYAKKNVLICFPTTYMNGSGVAVKKIAAKYEIRTQDIIVVVDEYNFPLGKVHLKNTGSDGGHNGMLNIITELGTRDFNRLRLGIDKNFGQGELVDYVLSNFAEEELPNLAITINKAVDSLECAIRNGVKRSMCVVNSEELWNAKEKKTQKIPEIVTE